MLQQQQSDRCVGDDSTLLQGSQLTVDRYQLQALCLGLALGTRTRSYQPQCCLLLTDWWFGPVCCRLIDDEELAYIITRAREVRLTLFLLPGQHLALGSQHNKHNLMMRATSQHPVSIL